MGYVKELEKMLFNNIFEFGVKFLEVDHIHKEVKLCH